MLCLRANPSFFLLLPLSFFLFISSAFASSRFHHTLRSPGIFVEKEYGGVVHWNTKKSVAEKSAGNSFLILAETRTLRKDPLDGFNRYTGGWNISNEHYWASVGLTAAPFFIIAGVWFVLFGLTFSIICLCYCCCPREPYGYSRTAYALSLIFLILVTLSAIAGCIVLYTGQGKFHSSTTNTLDYVVNQADTIVENLRNVSGYLAAAKGIIVDSIFLPSEVQQSIDIIETKIQSSASTLSQKTSDNSKDIQDGLDSVRLALIIVAAVMLFLAFLGFCESFFLLDWKKNILIIGLIIVVAYLFVFISLLWLLVAVFSILGMKPLVYFLIMIGWILVTGTFVLCGIFLLLHNVVADTCVAMDEWVQNPTAHTALDDILPCVDNATAQETLLQSKNVTYQLVIVVDVMINNISNVNFSPKAGPLYFNQSGPLIPVLCNPFHPDLSRRHCAPGEVQLRNAPEVWKDYTCQVSASGICATPGRLTPIFYSQMAAAVNVSYGLYRYAPFLIGLEDCTFARKTFRDISKDHCPGLRRYSEWIYIGLVIVSAAVMLSMIFWVIYARERRHRVYTKNLMARSLDEEDKAT